MATYAVLLAVFVAVGVGAVPYQYRSTDTCASECSGITNKFRYQAGTTYNYRYEVNTETSAPSQTDGTARVAIQATAEIEAGSRCDYTLRLRDVRVFQAVPYKNNVVPPKGDEELQTALEKNALRFSFDDGVIAEVCPEDSEDRWPLNFKKGVLSAFQNSMEDFNKKSQKVKEVDVSGECEAEYNMTKSWGWRKESTIKKSKDLLACSYRAGYRSLVQAVPYYVPSEIQSLPILKSSHKCQYVLNSDSLLKSVECVEIHSFAPFANKDGGVKTSVTQKLDFINQVARTSGSRLSTDRRQSLMFVHDDDITIKDTSRQAVEKKLKEICQQTKRDITPETPRLFTDLVEVIKGLEYFELENVYEMLQAGTICPKNGKAIKFFVDALPMCGTLSPIKLMAKLIEKKDVEGILAEAWIASLSFVKDVTEHTVQTVKPLLEGPYRESAMLPVSSLVSEFCKYDSKCQSNYYVREVVAELAKDIGYKCYVTDDKLGAILKSLRALGNIRFLADKNALDKCLTSYSAPLEVKVAAADAYRRSACPGTFQKDDALWRVLKDSEADVEVRVVSYRSIMRCPTEETLKDVSVFLKDVQEEQLGAFIYSHLNNLKETSDPHKQEIVRAISELDLEPVELNILKQSRNYEASFILNKLNMGATLDSDVIMSGSAPVPRAARINITMDLFGQAVNVLEVGGRMEGLETVLEKVLGYKMPLGKDVKLTALEDTRASVYARVFGNEVLFENIRGSDKLVTRDMIPDYLSILQKLSEKQTYSYTFSKKVLDFAAIYPTAAGIPLELTINGSATVDLQAQGKANLLKLTSKGRMNIDGEIRPSAALELSADMTVDALVTRQGLRTRNYIHSSTEVKATINLEKGKVLSVDIDAPRHGMEIFSAKSEFMMVYNGIEKEIDLFKDDSKIFKKCTGEFVATITGAELCGQVEPTGVSVKLNKRDTQTSYKFIAKHMSTKKNYIAQFQMDTPGSKINRLISADVTFGYSPDISMDLQFVSPWKRINFNTGAVYNKDMWSLTGTALIDDSDKYALTTEVKKSRDPKTKEIILTPFVEVTGSDVTLTLLSGQVTILPNKKVETNLEINDFYKTPYTVKGSLINLEKEKRAKLSVVSDGKDEYLVNIGTTITSRKGKSAWDMKPELIVKTPSTVLVDLDGSVSSTQKAVKGSLDMKAYGVRKPVSFDFMWGSKGGRKNKGVGGFFKLKSSMISFKLEPTFRGPQSIKVKLSYIIPKVDKNTVTWDAKLADQGNNGLLQYALSSNMINNKYPDYNFNMKAGLSHKRVDSSANIDLYYGKNRKDKSKAVVIATSLKRDFKAMDDMNIQLISSVMVPAKKIDMAFQGKHKVDPKAKSINTGVNLKLKPVFNSDFEAGITMQDKSRKWMKYIGNANVRAGDEKYTFDTNVVQKSKTQYVHSINAQTPYGDQYNVETSYKMPGKSRHQIVSDISLPKTKPIRATGKITLMPSSAQLSGDIFQEKKLYDMNAFYKFSKNSLGKWGFDFEYPGRKIEMSANGKKAYNKYDGDFMFNWDAGKKYNRYSEIKLNGSLKHESSNLFNCDLNLQTPFSYAKDVDTKIKYVNDPQSYNLYTKLSWGGKKDTVMSNLIVEKPLQLSNIQIEFNAATPLRQYRKVEMNVNHKLDSALLTTIKGKLDQDETELTVKGENKGNWYKSDLLGSVEMKTPFKELRRLSVSAEHKDDDRQSESSFSVKHNENKYTADLSMTKDQTGSALKHNGKLTLSCPFDRLETTWNHNHFGVENIDTSLNAKWGNNKKMDITLSGKNDKTWSGRAINGELSVKTPFRDYRQVSMKVDHSHDDNKLSSNAYFLNNRRKSVAYEIVFEKTLDDKTAKILIIPFPESDEINGEVSILHSQYPKTVSAFLQWSPESRVDLDGSLNVPSLSYMEMSGKLTTPFRSVRSVTVGGSHKLENKEYISHANLGYGVRKSIDFESRYRNDDRKKILRTKLETPFDSFKKIDTGVQFDAKRNGFEGKADFEMRPILRKHDGLLIVDYSPDEPKAKFQLNTPYNGPYFTVNAESKMNRDNSRTSFLEVVPQEFGTYKLDSTYKNSSPYRLDVGLKTPHPEFDDVGFKVSGTPGESKLDFQTVIVYLPGQQVETTLKANWADDIDGSLIVKTPLRPYQYNSLIVRHNGKPLSFTNHVEAKIGGQDAVSDITFSSRGRKAEGTAKLSSSYFGPKKVDSLFSFTGPIDSLRAELYLAFGRDNIKTVLSNMMKPEQLKSSITLHTPFTEDLAVSVDAEKSQNYYGEETYESGFDARKGKDSFNGQFTVKRNGIEDITIDSTLNTPFKKWKTFSAHFNNKINGDDVSGTAKITSSLKELKNIELTYGKEGQLDDMKVNAELLNDGLALFDSMVETHATMGEYHGKFMTSGKWLPSMSLALDEQFGDGTFSSTILATSNQVTVLDSQTTFKVLDTKVEVESRINFRYDGDDHSHKITFNKDGNWRDFTMDVTQMCDGKEISGDFTFKAKNKIVAIAKLRNLKQRGDVQGFEFEHSGDFDKFLTTGKVILNSEDAFSGKVDFYQYGMKRVELTTELSTPYEGYTFTKVNYRHEGQPDARSSCSFNVEYGDAQTISMDFVLDTEAGKNLNVNIKTPFEDYKNFILAADLKDDSTDAKLVFNDIPELTVKGSHDVYNYPIDIRYTVTTPLYFMKSVDVVIAGRPRDGSVVLTFNNRNSLRVDSKYDDFFNMDVKTVLTCYDESLTFVVKNTDNQLYGKQTHVQLDELFTLDGTYVLKTDSWSGEKTYTADLDVTSPYFSQSELKKVSTTVSFTDGKDMKKGSLLLTQDDKAVVDIDLIQSTSEGEKFTVELREPMPMEYSVFTVYQETYSGYTRKTDLSIFWDKYQPDSKLTMSLDCKHETSDKSFTLSFIRPSRTVTLEHSLQSTDHNMASYGKFSWSDDEESAVFYQMDLTSNQGRQDNALEALFKVGLPTRTLGFTGSLSDDTVTKKGEASFSWDMDKDQDKQIGVKATLSGRDYTKADISLKMPADMEVTSELILNQGNILLDGKTDISYSRDTRKTLTLFSKIKDIQGYSGRFFSGGSSGFNYSVEIGMSHPETRLDVTLDSHLGKTPDLLTSSVGVEYMTSRRQVVNMALTAEINQLKKQISLLAVGPSQNVGFSGRVVSESPFKMEVKSSVDGEDRYTSVFEIDQYNKKFTMDFGEYDNVLSVRAFYPNSSAIQADINLQQGYQTIQQSLAVLRLETPRLLSTRVDWRPEAVSEAQDWLVKRIVYAGEQAKAAVREAGDDLTTEISEKYRDMSQALSEDSKPVLEFVEEELEDFGKDILRGRRALMHLYRNNDFHFQDLVNSCLETTKSYSFVLSGVKSVYEEYTAAYKQILEEIAAKLQDVQNVDVRQNLGEGLVTLLTDFYTMVDQLTSEIVQQLEETEEKYIDLRNNYGRPIESLKKLYNKNYMDAIESGLENVRNSEYLRQMHASVKSRLEPYRDFDLQPYISYLPERFKKHVGELMEQVKPVYRYGADDKLFKERLNQVIENGRALVQDKVKQYSNMFQVPMFDFQHGKIWVKVNLPFDLQRLDEFPEFTETPDILQQIQKFVETYKPKVAETFHKVWPYSNETSDETPDVTVDHFGSLRRKQVRQMRRQRDHYYHF